MTYRNRRLLNLAHEMPCMVEFTHQCTGYLGCEPMHSDSQLFGRGGWHKSHDFAFAAGCTVAHRMLTAKVNDETTREQKFYDWLRAFVKTQEWLWANGKLKVSA